MTDTPFQSKDEIIWQALEKAGALDSICDLFHSIPKWIQTKFVADKTTPRVTKYADDDMPDAVAKAAGFHINPEWLRIRFFVAEKFLTKYVITRSASLNRDERERPPVALPSPEEQQAIEAEVVGEVVNLKETRDKAAAEQAAALKRVRQKRSG